MVIFLLLASFLMVFTSGNGSGYGFDPDITVGFDQHWMDQELAPDYTVSTPLPIHWYAWDSQYTEFTIDLFIKMGSIF
jgi:hypothetical protein